MKSMLCGAVSGGVAAACTTPFDFWRTRIMTSLSFVFFPNISVMLLKI